jgi:cell wall-associated NlpC family hydrolase
VSGAALRPGDLVFFHNPISHVGIYIGNGQMVHAPTTGDVVKISNISVMGPLAAARRLA